MSSITYKVKDNDTVQEIHKIVVHRFKVGDVEDPDMYAAQPMWEWQNTEKGKFVMKNAIEQPEWKRHMDFDSYTYDYAIIAKLEKKKLTEFYLRWGKI